MRVKIVRKHAPVCQSVSAENERVERAELLLITILFLHTTGPFNKPHNQTRPLQSASFKSIFNPRYWIKKRLASRAQLLMILSYLFQYELLSASSPGYCFHYYLVAALYLQ